MRKLQCLERAVAGKYERSFPLFYRYVIRRNIKKNHLLQLFHSG
jgi:hypothetical protein